MILSLSLTRGDEEPLFASLSLSLSLSLSNLLSRSVKTSLNTISVPFDLQFISGLIDLWSRPFQSFQSKQKRTWCCHHHCRASPLLLITSFYSYYAHVAAAICHCWS